MSDEVFDHIVRTGRNGELDDQSPAQVKAIATRVVAAPRVVLHFHGGLNGRADGEATATLWLPKYQDAGADPVFFVWESGFLDTIAHNLDEIAREEIFKKVLKKLLQFAVGRVRQDDGQRAAGTIPVPPERDVEAQLDGIATGQPPYENTSPSDASSPLSDSEREQFRAELVRDADLQAELDSVLAARHDVRGW